MHWIRLTELHPSDRRGSHVGGVCTYVVAFRFPHHVSRQKSGNRLRCSLFWAGSTQKRICMHWRQSNFSSPRR